MLKFMLLITTQLSIILYSTKSGVMKFIDDNIIKYRTLDLVS